MMKANFNHRIFRALLARFLALGHMGLSIFVLFYVKKDLLYLIPIFGAIALLCEAITTVSCFKGKEPIGWFSMVFFIYVSTIVTCVWLLEVENIKSIRLGILKKDYNIFNKYNEKSDGGAVNQIVGAIKVIWSQLEMQIFFALMMLIRWILPKSHLSPHGLSDLLFKYFAISCDMLDFLTILQDNTLVKSDDIVYSTLAIWTWSTFQFFIYVPKYEDVEKKEFKSYISNSLLSVFFLDLPYFCIRITAIFAYGSHNYNSYFFATKNIVMILLQIARIRATFAERTMRNNKNAKNLNKKIGFDKENQDLYNRELDIVAIKNFEQRSRNISNSNTPLNSQKQVYYDSSREESETQTPVHSPKLTNYEQQRLKGDSNASIPLMNQKPISFEEQKSRNASNCSTPVPISKPLGFAPTTKTNYFSPVVIQKPMNMPVPPRKMTDF